MSEQEPKTLSDAVKIAREKWYADHGGRDTVQELVHLLQRQAEEDRAAILEYRRVLGTYWGFEKIVAHLEKKHAAAIARATPESKG